MGIIQSIIRCLGDIADDEKLNERPQQNSYNRYNNSNYYSNSSREKSHHHQWLNGNYNSSTSTQSNLRSYSLYPNTSVNDGKVKVSGVFIKEITPPQNASLDSQDFLIKNYESATSNILGLSIRKCLVMHEIDATTMANHHSLGGIKFDRIIFNFPFAGFFKNLSRETQLRRHRILVNLFLKNAKEMLSENGEIHISHKTNGFHKEWNLESLASFHRLRLIEAVDFNYLDYPGYNTKCGFGGDNNFNCYPSKTYKFGLKC